MSDKHPRVDIQERDPAYRGYFSVNRYRLRHETHAGGWSPPLVREVLERGHTAALLPYDPIHDTVVLVEQFRIGAYAAGLDPWQVEVVAGVIEPGESAEEVARRETLEEAGCEVAEIEPIATVLLSSGSSSETCAMFCGRVDSNGAGGIHGLAEEGEDILVHVVPAGEAITSVNATGISSGYAAIPLLWLALNRERLRAKWR